MTPEYASPEQMGRHLLTKTTDIWSWAVVVLEMIKGGREWASGLAAPIVLQEISTADQNDPNELIRQVPYELIELLRACLDYKTESRPQGMGEVAQTLECIYKDVTGENYWRLLPEPGSLRSDSMNNRALSWLDLGNDQNALADFDRAISFNPNHLEARFNCGLFKWRKSKLSDNEFAKDLETCVCKTGEEWKQSYLQGLLNLERGDFMQAVVFFKHAISIGVESELVKQALQLAETNLQRMCRTRIINGHEGAVNAIASSYDLSKILTGGGKVWKVCKNGSKPAFSRLTDGGQRWCETSEIDSTIRLWDFANGECIKTMRGHEDIITAIVFSNDDLFALSGSADKTVRMWHLGSGSCTRVLKGHSEPVTSVAISQYGRLAVSGSRDNSVRLWDLSIGECIRIYEGHLKPVVLVKFSADGREIMSLASDGIRIWDSESSACIRVIESRELISMRENSNLKIADFGQHFEMVDPATRHFMHRICGANNISSNASRAVSKNNNGMVHFWHLPDGRCVRTILDNPECVRSVAISGDGEWVFTGVINYLYIWNMPKGIISPYLPCRPVPSGELVQSTRKFRVLLNRAQKDLSELRWSQAYEKLCEARKLTGYYHDPKVLRLCSIASRHGVRKHCVNGFHGGLFSGHSNDVTSVLFLPECQSFLSSSIDSTVRQWDLNTKKCLQTFEGHARGIRSIALTRDARHVISGGSDNTIRFWNLGNGFCENVIRGYIEPQRGAGILSVATSEGGSFFMSIDHYVLCQRSVATGKVIRIFDGPDYSLNSLVLHR